MPRTVDQGRGARKGQTMIRQLTGHTTLAFDHTGRIALLPAMARPFLTGCAALCVYGLRRPDLRLYPVDAVAKIETRIATMPRGTQERAALERAFFGKSIRLDFDPDAGLSIPLSVLATCRLEPGAPVVCQGLGDHLGFWPQAEWPGPPAT